MNNQPKPALRLVIDNTTPDPERERREQMASQLIALAESARRGELAALYWITVKPNQDVSLGTIGQWKEAADEGLVGLQVLGERLCKVLGRQPGTGWADE